MNVDLARTGRLVFAFAVTAVCLLLLWDLLELPTLLAALQQLTWAPVLAALLLVAAGYSLRILRWWWLLRPLTPTLPLRNCVAPFLGSMAVNNLLPLRAGDALRVIGFRRQLQTPAAQLLATLASERMLDLLSLLLVFHTALWLLPAANLPQGVHAAATVLTLGATGAVLLVLLFTPLLLRWLKHPDQPPAKDPATAASWRRKLRHQLQHLLTGLAPLRSPVTLIPAVLLSLSAWLLEAGAFVTLASALDLGGAAGAPWLGMAMGTLGTLLPSAPGYLGTFDIFAAMGAQAAGSPASVAAIWALAVHALLWLSVTAAGVAALIVTGTNPRHALAETTLHD